MWSGEMAAFEAWTQDMDPEKVAFLRVMLYHQREGMNACSGGCEFPLGSSFAEHLWTEFDSLRSVQ